MFDPSLLITMGTPKPDGSNFKSVLPETSDDLFFCMKSKLKCISTFTNLSGLKLFIEGIFDGTVKFEILFFVSLTEFSNVNDEVIYPGGASPHSVVRGHNSKSPSPLQIAQ
ncbi:hypothetical protein PGB90_010115 [Kerria lacca]